MEKKWKKKSPQENLQEKKKKTYKKDPQNSKL